MACPLAGLRAWVKALMGWLLVLQLVVPALGLMHQTLHPVPQHRLLMNALASPSAQATQMAHAGQSAHAGRSGHDHSSIAQEGFLTLFGEHTEVDCQLYDQMAVGVALLATPWHWAPPPPVRHAGWNVQAGLLRKSPALFFARGPPATLLG